MFGRTPYETQYRSIMNNIMQGWIDGGTTYRQDRTGVGCNSVFNQSIKIDLADGFPVLTGKRVWPKIFNTEFLWFINGETNIKRLTDNNVTIWDEWADEDGNLGPVYGHQARNFNSQGIDQIDGAIKSIGLNPDSRRHIISLWNPAQLDEMALPPCYLYFQFFARRRTPHGGIPKLDMFVVQRSADWFLGVPYDVALFTNILCYVASKASDLAQENELTGYVPGKLEMNFIDAHIYSNHREACAEYLKTPYKEIQPAFAFHPDKGSSLINYDPLRIKNIKAEVAV